MISKEHKHFGIYGLVIENGKILLIKKVTGPYDGKLDLPGGSPEFGERPEETLRREILEETGITITDFELYDVDSVKVDWFLNDRCVKVHHTGVFYKIVKYNNEVKSEIDLDNQNDDSMGAEFYDIKSLNRDSLSMIALLELEKLGYELK